MKLLLTTLLALLGFASSTVAADVTLRVGDCWSYATRPGEEGSFLVIRKIEVVPKIGEIVHVSVFGLKFKGPSTPKDYTDQVGHLPIAGPSLRSSLKAKVQRTIPPVDWQKGYQRWLEAKGAVFSKPVSECIEFMEGAINHGKKS